MTDPAAPAENVPGDLPPNALQHATRSRRRRRLAIAGGIAALVAAGGVAVATVNRGPEGTAALPCATASPDAMSAQRPAEGPTGPSSELITAAPRPAAPAEARSLPPDCWPSAFPGATPEATESATPGPDGESDPQAGPDAGQGSPDAPSAPLAPPADATGPDGTGVPGGVALADGAAGDFDTDGLVIDGQHIVGDVTLTGDAQVVRNSRIEGHLIVRGAGTVVEDAEVGALSVSGATSFTARRVEVFGATGRDGIHITSGGDTRAADVVIEDSWIHSPKVEPDAHYDGVQVRGVDRLTLRGNTIDLGRWAPEYNAAIFLEGANGGNADIVVEGNVVNGGGYSVYVEGTNVSFVDNQFGRDARWGLLYPDHDRFTAEGNTWVDTGAAAPLP